MKRILLVAIACALVAGAASPAWSAGLRVYGSYWDAEDLQDTLGGGAALAIPLGGSKLNLDLRGTFYQQFEDEDFFDRLTDKDRDIFLDNAVEVLPLEIGLSFNLGHGMGNFNPVIGAGASYFMLDTDRGDIDDEVGYYGSLGLEFTGRGNLGYFVEAVYRNAEATVVNEPNDPSELDDVELDGKVDVDLSGLGVNAGIVWRW